MGIHLRDEIVAEEGDNFESSSSSSPSVAVFLVGLFLTIFICALLNCWIERRRFEMSEERDDYRNVRGQKDS